MYIQLNARVYTPLEVRIDETTLQDRQLQAQVVAHTLVALLGTLTQLGHAVLDITGFAFPGFLLTDRQLFRLDLTPHEHAVRGAQFSAKWSAVKVSSLEHVVESVRRAAEELQTKLQGSRIPPFNGTIRSFVDLPEAFRSESRRVCISNVWQCGSR